MLVNSIQYSLTFLPEIKMLINILCLKDEMLFKMPLEMLYIVNIF